VHPRRRVHHRLIAVALVFVPWSAVAAPRCLRDSCAQRLLRHAARCFDAGGSCVRDDPAGVTCWENGAHSLTRTFAETGAEQTVYVNPAGRTCQIVTSIVDPTGYERTTHLRRHRRVIFQSTADGLRVRCPGGRVERYTTADLAAPECADTTPPTVCDPGLCGQQTSRGEGPSARLGREPRPSRPEAAPPQ